MSSYKILQTCNLIGEPKILTMTGFEPALPDPKAGALPIQPHGLSWKIFEINMKYSSNITKLYKRSNYDLKKVTKL